MWRSVDNWRRAAVIAGALTLVVALGGCGGSEGDEDPAVLNDPGPVYAIGGGVTGLVGTGLILQNNGGDDLPMAADGGFAFNTRLASGTAYAVTVKTQPTNPVQTCTVGKGSGTVAATDVLDVAVACNLATGGGDGGGGGGGGGGGVNPTGTYYSGSFKFNGSYDSGRGTYAGEAQLRFNFEIDGPNERRYVLAAASAVFTKWEQDGAAEFCVMTADSTTPMASSGYLNINPADSSYLITGGLLVFQGMQRCTHRTSGNVTTAPTIMQIVVVSTGAAGDPVFLPLSGDGSVIDGGRTYVGAQNVLTQQNQWHLERRPTQP